MFFTLFNVQISTENKDQLLDRVSKYLTLSQSEKPLVIVTPNPEQIVYAQKDDKFRVLLNSADISLPDGVGIVWAASLVQSDKFRVHRKKLLRTSNFEPQTKLERIPGIEFIEDLVKFAAEKDYPVGLIGGREGVALKSLNLLQEKYPGLTGWAEEPEINLKSQISNLKYTNEKNNNEYVSRMVQRIKETKTRLIFVGLGAPKQEYFMRKLSSKFKVQSSQKKQPTSNYQLRTTNSLVLMSVGGAFDVISGKLPRAPEILRKIGLEWLWRLVREPWRIRRQSALLKFFLLTLQQRFMVE